MLPAKITPDQAIKFSEALAKGEPNRIKIALTGANHSPNCLVSAEAQSAPALHRPTIPSDAPEAWAEACPVRNKNRKVSVNISKRHIQEHFFPTPSGSGGLPLHKVRPRLELAGLHIDP
jgi:hypothetical protein